MVAFRSEQFAFSQITCQINQTAIRYFKLFTRRQNFFRLSLLKGIAEDKSNLAALIEFVNEKVDNTEEKLENVVIFCTFSPYHEVQNRSTYEKVRRAIYAMQTAIRTMCLCKRSNYVYFFYEFV